MGNKRAKYRFLIALFTITMGISQCLHAQGIYVWSSINGGVNGHVNAIVEYQDDIIVAGAFTQAGGVPALNIARWTGTNWEELGGGLNGEIYALTVFGTDLIAAGKYLQTTTNDTAYRVFKLVGNQWTPLGTGFLNRANEFVKTLHVHNGILYAGGNFKLHQTAGGASNIAKLSGNSWQNMGDGLDLEVLTITAYQDDIIAGGKFTASDTTQVNHVARWDNGKWQRMGNGLNGDVFALSEFNGSLIAGGDFPGNISRWNGNWNILGNGVSDTVKALSSYNGNLIVGGSFRYAGATSDSFYVNGVARWNNSSWSRLLTGMDKDVRSLFVDELDRIFAGGSFISAGGDSVNRISVWDTVPAVKISGTVFFQNNNQPVNNGIAKAQRYDIYTRDIILYDSSRVQIDGSYELHVPSDRTVYVIIVAEDEDNISGQGRYIPTYYPSTIYWENATLLQPLSDLVDADVFVEQLDYSVNPGSISGKVLLNYTPQGYPNGNNLDIKAGAIVYARIGGSWKNFAISDRFENYSLSSMPEGNYQLIVNRLGYSTQVKNNVMLSPGQQLTNINFTLTISDGGSVNISGNTNTIPEKYLLHQNYPNPFNPVSNIKFELPEKGIVNLKVYNTAGQVVSELLNHQVLSAGIYTAEFDGGNLASGIYFYNFEIVNENTGIRIFSGTKKMVLIK